MVERPRRLLGLLLVLGLWEACTRRGQVGRTLLASPEEVLAALWASLDPVTPVARRVFVHAGATLGRALGGWLLALGFGVAGGAVVGALRRWLLGTDALVEFARAIPPILVFPLFLVAFDYGDGAYVSTVAFGACPVVVTTVARAVEGISRERLDVLRVFDVGPMVRAGAAVMEVLPGCALGARLALSLSLVVAVVTEMVFTPRSGVALGAMAKDAQMSFDTPVLYAAIAVIGATGFMADRALRALERRLGGGEPPG